VRANLTTDLLGKVMRMKNAKNATPVLKLVRRMCPNSAR
jgi:hypothetical protein